MKQFVKQHTFFFAALCGLCLCATFALAMPAAAADYPLVNDEAALLSSSEVTALQEKAEEYSEKWQQDIVIYTTNDIGNSSAMEAADDYFDYSGFGQGDDYSGVVLLLDMGGREYWISTCGSTITALTDDGISYIGDEIIDDLSSGDYADAFDTYLDTVDALLAIADEGSPYDASNTGGISSGGSNSSNNGSNHSNHSNNSGSSQSGFTDEVLPVFFMAWCMALVVTLVFYGVGLWQLHSKKSQRSARDYLAGGGLRLTNRQDYYLYSTTRRVRKQENNGGRGGSSTHRGSSGRSHGGGGGRF